MPKRPSYRRQGLIYKATQCAIALRQLACTGVELRLRLYHGRHRALGAAAEEGGVPEHIDVVVVSTTVRATVVDRSSQLFCEPGVARVPVEHLVERPPA